MRFTNQSKSHPSYEREMRTAALDFIGTALSVYLIARLLKCICIAILLSKSLTLYQQYIGFGSL